MTDTPTLTPLPWRIHVVPGSHFDLGWCLNTEGALAVADSIIREALDTIVGPHPEYRFTIEYVEFVKHFLDTWPEYTDTLKHLLREGRVEICATRVGAMEQIFDGETLARELTLGIRWLKEHLDYTPVCAQHTDLPGHTIQIAQILARCRIPFMAYSRYRPPVPLHVWESPDGSRIIAANHVHHYNWGYHFRAGHEHATTHLLPGLKSGLRKLWPDPNLLMPEEHDLDRIDPVILGNIDEWNRHHSDTAAARCSILREFFDSVDAGNLPVYKGEMPYGFYSIPAYEPHTYQEGRYAENALTNAEKWSALREITGLGRTPQQRIEEGWLALFWPHDHNIAGQDGSENDAAREHQARHARFIGEGVLHEVKATLLNHVETNRDLGRGVVVMNPLAWRRTDIVETRMGLYGSDFDGVEVVDAEGNIVPSQLLDREGVADGRIDYALDNPNDAIQVRVAFEARDIPATGYSTFYIRKGNPSNTQNLKASPTLLGNRFFTVRFSEGLPVAVADNTRERDIADTEEHLFGQLVALEDLRGDLEDGYDPWDPRECAPNFTGRRWNATMEPESGRVVESGPVRAKVCYEGMLLDSSVTQTWTLYDNVPRLDFELTIDWQGERCRQIRMLLPFEMEDPSFTYETPFGHVVFGKDEIPNTYRGDGTRWVQKWFDASVSGFGVTIGSGCCGVNFHENIASPMLLSTTYCRGDAYYWMENRGLHTWRFSLVTHDGNWKEAATHRAGWEHWNPLDVARVQPSLYSMKGWERLPVAAGYLEVEDPRLCVSAFKRADDGEGYILRLFNVSGEEVRTRIQTGFSLEAVTTAWMTEESQDTLPRDENGFMALAGPYAIKTYRLRVKHD